MKIYYNVEEIKGCLEVFKENFDKMYVEDSAQQAYNYALVEVERSLDKIDDILGLFDLATKESKQNIEQIMFVINDHMRAKENGISFQSHLLDYEITLIKARIKNLIEALRKAGEYKKLSEETRRTILDSEELIKTQREKMAAELAEYEAAQEEARKMQEEAEAQRIAEENGTDAEDTAKESVEAEDVKGTGEKTLVDDL